MLVISKDSLATGDVEAVEAFVVNFEVIPLYQTFILNLFFLLLVDSSNLFTCSL